MNEIFRFINHAVELHVATAAYNEQQIIDCVSGQVEERYETSYFLEHIEQITADALKKRAKEEKLWTTPTDHDRLMRAFELLDTFGVVTFKRPFTNLDDAQKKVVDALSNGRDQLAGLYYTKAWVADAVLSGRLKIHLILGRYGYRMHVVSLLNECLSQHGLTLNSSQNFLDLSINVIWQARLFKES